MWPLLQRSKSSCLDGYYLDVSVQLFLAPGLSRLSQPRCYTFFWESLRFRTLQLWLSGTPTDLALLARYSLRYLNEYLAKKRSLFYNA